MKKMKDIEEKLRSIPKDQLEEAVKKAAKEARNHKEPVPGVCVCPTCHNTRKISCYGGPDIDCPNCAPRYGPLNFYCQVCQDTGRMPIIGSRETAPCPCAAFNPNLKKHACKSGSDQCGCHEGEAQKLCLCRQTIACSFCQDKREIRGPEGEPMACPYCSPKKEMPGDPL
jgi:hypothetical protein